MGSTRDDEATYLGGDQTQSYVEFYSLCMS